MDLQQQFREETDADTDLPMRVGIGIDSGEAIELEDGSFRGAALNVAARLSALAHGEEVIVSEGTSHLAGRLQGLRYVDRGRAHLKGISDPVRVIRVADEDEGDSRWIVMFFGGRRGIGWGVGLLVVLVAAFTAAAVVYLTSDDTGPQSSAQPGGGGGRTGTETETETEAPADGPAESRVAALMPAALWEGCEVQSVPDIGAVETAVCLPPADGTRFSPDRWSVSIYPDGGTLQDAYEAERQRQGVDADQGRCSVTSWGGEAPWEHGPGKPGGRNFCYFDGDDAVIVWSHERRGQPDHEDILGIARESGSDHARLTRWWRVQHHLIGKSE